MRRAWRGWAGWVSSAVVLALAACGGDAPPDGDASPEVMATEGVDFGRRPVGETSEATAELYNGGAAPLTITGLFVEGRDPAAFQVGSVPATVRPGQTLALPLSFRPGEARAYAAEVIVATTGTPARVVVAISGVGAPWLDRAEIDFGKVVETTVALEEVHLENLLDRPLTLEEIRIEPAGQSPPFVAAADRTVLDPGDRATLTVRFEPRRDSTWQSELVLAPDGPGGELRLPLLGRGSDWVSVDVLGPGPRAVTLTNRLPREVTATLEVLAPFTVSPSELVLPPGASVRAEIGVDSDPPGDVSRTLEVRAPDLPRVEVELHRDSLFAAFLAPGDFDFGSVRTGCASRAQDFCVYNVGAIPLTLTSAELVGADAFQLGEDSQDVTILAGDRYCMTVTFAPVGLGEASAILALQVAELPKPLAARLEGLGMEGGVRIESFHTQSVPKIDILLVLDRDASMADHREVLEDELRSLGEYCIPERLGPGMADVHIGLVSADPDEDGVLRPWGRTGRRVLAPGMTSPGAALLSAADLHFEDTPHNQPMHVALRALSPDRAAGTNAGFRREDAHLAVVLVSDRADTSPLPVTRYAEALGAHRPGGTYVLPVVGGSPPCASACGEAVASGERMSALAEIQDGYLPDTRVCDCAWRLGNLCRFASSGPYGLYLPYPPPEDPSEMEVWVTPPEGAPYLHTEWSFDARRNAIDFDRGAYPLDSLVDVHYVPGCGA